MPVVDIPKRVICAALKREFTDAEFSDLCFEFGIELDGVTSEKQMREKEGKSTAGASEEIIYKVEVPANRYDLVCIEGLSKALNAFRGLSEVPVYKLSEPKETIFVEPSVLGVREHVVCAVLRNITFDQQSYNSFIDLQEKLHRNICRLRTLASVGTHDLDTIQGPFVYRAEKPEEIKFAPLDNTKVVNGHELMTQLETHNQLKQFLHIIREKPLYPVIRDSTGTVLSLPPIINGDHSKITLNTKNVFIEVTAVDVTKARIVLDSIVTCFSQHCSPQFIVEPVTVITKAHGDVAEQRQIFPCWNYPTIETSVDYVNKVIGIKASAPEMIKYLARMSVPATIDPSGKTILVKIPPTRSDIMHPCDIMEDVAIAYGFNRLRKVAPSTVSEGKQLPINQLSDSLRNVIAQTGYLEMLSFILSTKADNYKNLNLPPENAAKEAVELSNPVGNIQICRTSMLPGLLNSLAHNKNAIMPIKVFEIGDIVIRDPSSDVGAKNVRQLAAVFVDKKTAGFEEIHGLLDRVMLALNVDCKGWTKPGAKPKGREYSIVEASHPTFFPGRCANVVLDGKVIGHFGVVHPEVIDSFKLSYPASALVLNIEPFL